MVLVWYFMAPLDRPWTPRMALLVLTGLAAISGIVVWQARAVMTSAHPRLRATSVLLGSLPLVLVLFAAAYVVMSHDRRDAFTEAMTRIDALYFAMTVFATVGFGDILPLSQPARLLVLVQMLADLLYVGLLVRALFEAAQIGVRRREAGD